VGDVGKVRLRSARRGGRAVRSRARRHSGHERRTSAPAHTPRRDATAPRSLTRALPARPPARAQKNGEKKLRAQLTRTPEWCSSAARDAAVRPKTFVHCLLFVAMSRRFLSLLFAFALARCAHAWLPPPAADTRARACVRRLCVCAAQADALSAAFPALGSALRSRQCSRLTKRDLFELCAYWAYASDLWRARGNRPARPLPAGACTAAAAAAAAVPTPPLQQQPPRGDSAAGGSRSGDDDTDSSAVRGGGGGVKSEGGAAAAAAAPLSIAWLPSPYDGAGSGGDELCFRSLAAGGSLDAGALWAHIGLRLRPLSAAAGRGAAGPAARAVAARDAAAARLFARELPHMRDLDEKLRTTCVRRAPRQRRRHLCMPLHCIASHRIR
jgi:hypothetical protein